jgi:Alcohol dehydrogenase GroES-like domain
MRATVIHGAGDVRIEHVPDPVLQQPTDAVVRVLRACICGSDLWPYRSMEPSPEGRRIGHEFLGIVEDAGADVPGFARGDLVVAPFVWSDGTCEFCREGLQTSCSWLASVRSPARRPGTRPRGRLARPATCPAPATPATANTSSRHANASDPRPSHRRRPEQRLPGRAGQSRPVPNPHLSPYRGWTTPTGQGAWWSTARLTEPSVIPRTREPTTSICASQAAASSATCTEAVLTVDRLDCLGEVTALARLLPAVCGALLQEAIGVAVIRNALRALRPGIADTRLAA